MDDKRVGSKVEVYLRASTPLDGHPDEVIGYLEELRKNGCIEDFSVREVPKQAEINNESSKAVQVFQEIESWASNNGVSIQPFFDREKYESSLSGNSGEIVTFPVMSVSVYEDDELRAVYPCSNGQGNHTVHECLHELESN